MKEDIVIRAENLSKKYIISHKAPKKRFFDGITGLFSKKNAHNEEFYALKNLNFEIPRGEITGIIGRNGAGKSTLLKIISEVVEPSSGRILINGSVASVLEVGMGFHPDLSGRENIFLSGMLLGIPKQIIKEKFEEIVDFSGIGRFIDTPVKNYSNGMYVRLAFAVVTSIDADILLFDEILSVGDLSFQQKCTKKIKKLAQQNKSILIVSHNTKDIIDLCSSVILIENGEIAEYGNINTLKNYYEDSIINDKSVNQNIIKNKELFNNEIIKEWTEDEFGPESANIIVKKVFIKNESRINDNSFYAADSMSINISFLKLNETNEFDFGIILSNMGYTFLFTEMNMNKDTDSIKYEKGVFTAKLTFPPYFFYDALIDIGFVLTDNSEICFMNFQLLRIKISIPQTELNYYNARFNNLVLPLRPKMNWNIIQD